MKPASGNRSEWRSDVDNAVAEALGIPVAALTDPAQLKNLKAGEKEEVSRGSGGRPKYGGSGR